MKGWVKYALPRSSEVVTLALEDEVDAFHHGSAFALGGFNKPIRLFSTHEVEEIPPLDFSDIPGAGWKVTHKARHMQKVKLAVDRIRSGQLEKVVLSAADNREPLDITGALHRWNELREENPNAMVYLLAHEDHGMWLGATPETLVSWSAGVFRTQALAGTRHPEDNTPFQPKEYREQGLVASWVEEKLADCGLTARSHGPASSKAGRLTHLSTQYSGLSTREQALQLASALNPTPAVCGVPYKEAVETIAQLEGHDRSLYTGVIGPVSEGAMHLFVNLRCAHLSADALTCFAGGGIVADSDPEAEWTEVRQKMKVAAGN